MRRHILLLLCLCGSLLAQYTHVLHLSLDMENGRKNASVTLSKRGGGPCVSLEIGRTLVLKDMTTNPPEKRLEANVKWSAGRHSVQVWFSETVKTQLVVDGVVVKEGMVPLALPSRAELAFQTVSNVKEAAKPVFQKLGDIQFSDDFARTDEDGGEEFWTVHKGRFSLNMSLNPGSSLGAFQYWGGTEKGEEGLAVAKTSQWFWRNFRYGASTILSDETQTWGLAFAIASPTTFHRVEFDGGAGQVRLIRRVNGTDQILAEAPCHIRGQAWSRGDLIAANGRVTAYWEGTEVLDIQEPKTFAGPVGLYLRDTVGVYFDDVKVVSAQEIPSVLTEPLGPCEQNWSDFSGKHFLTDPFMSQWAHPRASWNKEDDGLFWFRSRLFEDVVFEWRKDTRQAPLNAFRINVFAEEGKADSGLTLQGADGKVTALLQGKELVTAELPAAMEELRLDVGESLRLSMHGKSLMEAELPQDFARRGFLAADLGAASDLKHLDAADWRDSALVSSSHRMDYSFEHAPTAWHPQAGSWKATHRWACVPRWSFFAGRGEAGPTEVKHGNAVLWNLRQIKGDFDLEVFAAPMEGTPQRAHFTYPTTINLSFAADGTALDSGYTFVNGMYDLPSILYYKERRCAENGDRVVNGLRRNELHWYNRVTRVWQHFRIQRRDGRIRIDSASHNDNAEYVPLKTVFDEPDASDPSVPSQFALWTWGENGLAVARATLSFQESTGAGRTAEQFPAPELRKGKGKKEPKEYTRVVNPISGGQFVTVVHDKPFDLKELNKLSMWVRPGEDTHLSLILTMNGQAAEIPLSGPVTTRPFTFLLQNRLPEAAAGMPGWLKVDVPLEACARPYFQPDERIIVTSIAIASPYDTIEEIAGLGVNRAGATVDFAPPILSFAKQDVEVSDNEELPNPCVNGRRLLQDFERNWAPLYRFGGADGAALLRVPRGSDGDNGGGNGGNGEADGGRALRLLNQNVGGTAGVVLSPDAFSVEAFPRLEFDYAIPVGIEIDLVAETDKGNIEIDMTGTDNTWKSAGAVEIVADGQWHHASVNLAELLKPHLDAPYVVRRLMLADPFRMSSYQRLAYYLDNVAFVPALAENAVVELANPAVEAMVALLDNAAETVPEVTGETAGSQMTVAVPEGGATWMHVRMKRNGQWSATRHVPVATAAAPVPTELPAAQQDENATPGWPPLISYIPSDRLVRVSMETEEGATETPETFGGMEIRREAWCLRNTATAATGKACAELVNLNDDGFNSIFFRKASWDVNRWPCISFNYRFRQPKCALNLSFLVNDGMAIVAWTNKLSKGSYFEQGQVGSAEPLAIQDGKWHETTFDFREMLLTSRFPKGVPPTGMTAAEFATWATDPGGGGGYTNPFDARVYFDNLTIYSNRGRDPAFEWSRRPDDAAYAVCFDQNPETIPPEDVTQTESAASYPNTAPGTWYLHVRAKNNAGEWSETAHKCIRIEE